MNRPCTGNGLLIAGGIVTLIGLGLVLTRTLNVSREWTTLLIGLALLAAGLLRRASRPDDRS
jgi:hypothetical protein